MAYRKVHVRNQAFNKITKLVLLEYKSGRYSMEGVSNKFLKHYLYKTINVAKSYPHLFCFTMEISMQKLAVLAILFPFTAMPVLADHGQAMSIQYYWDGGCSNYAGEQMLGYADNHGPFECKQFYIAGSWSANIADCIDTAGCNCTFYTDDQCKSEVKSEYNTGFVYHGVQPNCAHNDGNGFRSYNCFVYSLRN